MNVHLVPLTCNHFTKRGPKSFLLKKHQINKSTELPILCVGIQIAHYTNVKNQNITVKLVDITGHLPACRLWLNVLNDGLDDFQGGSLTPQVWGLNLSKVQVHNGIKLKGNSSLSNIYGLENVSILLVQLFSTKIMQKKRILILL